MPRRRVLTAEQLEELLALPVSEPKLVRHYTLTRAELETIARRRRDPNRLGFALQLCALRYPGRLLRPGEAVPAVVVRFIGEQLGLGVGALADYATRFQTRYDHSSALQAAFGYRPFAGLARREIEACLPPVALTTTSSLAVAEVLMDELRCRRIIAPGPSVIERLVAAAMLEAERHVAGQLAQGLTPAQAAGLDGLLEVHPDMPHLSRLSWARRPPGVVGHRSLTRVIAQLDHLRAIGLDPTRGGRVHPERLRQLAREGAKLTAQHLRALAPTRRRAILVATVLDTMVRLTDDAIELFDRLIGKLFRRAEAREASLFQRDARAINAQVRLFARLGEVLIRAKQTGEDPLEAVAAAIGWDKLKEGVEAAKRLVRPEGPDYLALAARGYPVIRKIGPLLLDAFEFRAVPAAGGVLRAVEAMRAFYRSARRVWPRHAPTGFIRKAWRAAVLTAEGIDRRAYELCLFAALRERLRAGDVWVEGSRRYRAVEDQLIARPLFEALRAAGPLPVAVPLAAGVYLEARRALLEQRLAEVAEKAAHDRLEDVRIAGDSLKITPLRAATPEAAETLAERLYNLLPSVRITELLAEVDRWTSFSTAFTHLRSGLPAEDRRVVLTAVLADATNLGLTRMAEACGIASRRQLVWTAGWHLREQTYRQALAVLVNAQQRQPLAARFGSGLISSSDGQHFLVGGPGEAVGTVNAHHGREPAVSFYTHLSDRFAPFHVKLLPAAAGEAVHVIDGLLYHDADLDIAVHHTDGGGVSDHVFALCHLLGFRFAPRIPNLADRRLYTFGPASGWPVLEPFIAGRIDTDLIAAHWEDVLRLATSIRTGVVSASSMLKRLGAYPRRNGLALALREIGRLERTLFTLDWLESPALRRQATAELNKGEAKNALQRAVCFHRLGRIRDRGLEGQKHRASGLTLVVAAITLWNTVYLGRAFDMLQGRGGVAPDELLAHIAPLGWQHINLTGDYLWTVDPQLGPDGLRPLRSTAEASLPAWAA
jgi:TnpA family transposase